MTSWGDFYADCMVHQSHLCLCIFLLHVYLYLVYSVLCICNIVLVASYVRLYFWGAPKSLQMMTETMKLRHLLLGRKVMTNLDSIFKRRDITLLTKVFLVKAMVFLVVMYVCDSWTVKKAERRRINAFQLWCWRRLLRVPWTANRSSQSILKFSPGISLEGLILKLKLQYFGHLMGRVDTVEKTLTLGGIEGRRRRGWQRMRWLDGITDSMDVESEWTPGIGDGQGGLACCDSWGRKELDTTEQLNWTELN